MVSRFIEDAWEAYKKNAGLMIGAQIVYFLAIFAILLVSLVPLIAAGLGALVTENPPYTPEIMEQFAGPFLAFLIGVLLAAIAAVALDTGRIGIYADILKKKEARVQTMFRVAKEKFWTSVGSALLSAAIIIVVALAILFLTAALAAINLFMAPLTVTVAMIAIVLFALMFSLTRQAIVSGNRSAVQSVEESYTLVKRNYREFLGIVIIIVAIAILLTFAGALGIIVTYLVLKPIADIAYTAFYMERAGKIKEKERKKPIKGLKEINTTKKNRPPVQKSGAKPKAPAKKKRKENKKPARILSSALRKRTELINP